MQVGARLIVAGILSGLIHAACGGSDAAPTPTTGGGSGGSAPPTVTVAIVGQAGSQAYVPPSPSVGASQTVAFRNSDGVSHRIVGDRGEFDTGNLAPGVLSQTVTVSSTTAIPFHCTIHPSMVGAINAPVSGGETPPPAY